jgi:hypothetical protein
MATRKPIAWRRPNDAVCDPCLARQAEGRQHLSSDDESRRDGYQL